MTIKNLYPKSRPQTIYNVINGRPELPAASTFSRASEATYVDANGIIRTAAIDEPRFNYDPATGEFLGLLLEEEVTNSLKFTNSYGCFSGNLTMDPLPVNNVQISPDDTQNACQLPEFGANNNISQKNYPNLNGYGLVSFFVKKTGSSPIVRVFIGNSTSSSSGNDILYQDIFNLDTLQAEQGVKYIEYPNGWYRLWKVLKGSSDQGPFVFRFEVSRIENGSTTYEGFDGGSVWGCQLERLGNTNPSRGPSSYIEAQADGVTRNADAFSLASSSNFDNGFSLLLDSDTTTDDFIYKIKAGGSTIAELTNANGTFDWIINGTSTANSVPPQYPQIGLIQPGRIKTVSSFGAAGDGDQTNYLYTEGLSLPTVAEPAVGADELEFGPGQTLKVVYLWNGQLSSVEAVSVIKGKNNVVIDEPIKSDSYSFVYNTDPTNEGIALITLPYIVPTVSMRIYWGDTTSTRYEQGVLPQHTYPYPGQYRIQIVADDGFDAVRLGDIADTIQRVDQWAPQFRDGASGSGFTGDQLYYMLSGQKALGGTIPAFKYTDLTTLHAAFSNCTGQVTAINLSPWEYIPTDIPLVTNLTNAFSALGRYNNEASPDRTNFPTLTTSAALTSVNSTYANMKLPNFVNDRPFTDTSAVTNWRNCFSGNSLTNLIVDTSAATSLSGTFGRNSFVISPSIDSSNCTDFTGVMNQNTLLTTQLAWDTSSGLNFSTAWDRCSSLASFPALDFSNATSLEGTFSDTGLTSFPPVTMPTGPFSATGMFDECSDLAGGSSLDFSNCTYARALFRSCVILSTMPAIDAPNNTDLYQAYRGCAFTTVVAMNTGSVEVFSGIFQDIAALDDVSELANWDLSSATAFTSAFNLCSSLTDFPANVFDTTGTLASNAFDSTWKGSALTAQSIENVLVSLDTNGASNITLGIDDGTNAGQSTWTAAANTAYTNLINKGWTISSNP